VTESLTTESRLTEIPKTESTVIKFKLGKVMTKSRGIIKVEKDSEWNKSDFDKIEKQEFLEFFLDKK
jgi:hypothetical protein